MATPNPPLDPEDEPVGAVRQAAGLLLAGRGDVDPGAVRRSATEAAIFQGTGTLILGLVETVADTSGDRLEVVAPLLRRLRLEAPELPAEVVASVGGALVAAAYGCSPTRWRRSDRPFDPDELPVPAIEAYAWTVTGRLLVDLIDHLMGVGTATAMFAEL